jgi:hypothetical protein
MRGLEINRAYRITNLIKVDQEKTSVELLELLERVDPVRRYAILKKQAKALKSLERNKNACSLE